MVRIYLPLFKLLLGLSVFILAFAIHENIQTFSSWGILVIGAIAFLWSGHSFIESAGTQNDRRTSK